MNFSKLTEYLNSLTGKEAAGSDVAVFKDGKPIYRHMSGFADIKNGIKISANTIYPLFSSTKIITCIAAFMLYEQGKFDLDEKLSDYFPEFSQMKVKIDETETKDAENPILIRHLFSMMAGFSYDLELPSLFEYRVETGGECPTSLFPSYLAKEPLMFEPGTSWKYSVCHDVIGALIEKWSGMTFGEFLEKSIFNPLKMKDTHFILPEGKLSRVAERYRYNEETAQLELCPNNVKYRLGSKFESGGAGLYSTVDDYMLFMQAVLSEKLIKRETINLMNTNYVPESALSVYQTGNRGGCGYGLGVKMLLDASVNDSKASLGSFGWGGATGTHLLFDFEKNLALFYAKNVSSPDGFIPLKIENLLYEALEI